MWSGSGHASGQVASDIAIRTIVHALKTGDPPPAPGQDPLVAAMKRESGRAGATFVDLLPTFNRSKARLCAYSYTCSADDPHPTDAGHAAIASVLQSMIL